MIHLCLVTEPIGTAKPKLSDKVKLQAVESIANTLTFTEPIGSAKPKFSSEVRSQTLDKAESKATSLTCPAQGSPIPSYR